MTALRRLGATALAFLAALGATTGPVAANGIGDLYAAGRDGVLELHVVSESIVNTVPLSPAPAHIAFTPDGLTLYASAGGRRLVHIDIETIQATGTISLPADGTTVAHPRGGVLAVAYPSRKTLGLVNTTDDSLTESPALPGAVDLLAADRREARLLAAEETQRWIAVFDPATRALRTATLDGEIAAIAIDRSGSYAYIAMSGPDALVRLSLDDLSIDWRTALPGPPSAVVSTAAGPVVAGAASLWRVDGTEAKAFGKAGAEIASLAVSDEGTIVYASMAGKVQAFDAAGKISRTIKLPAGSEVGALAAVPHLGSLAAAGAGAGAGGSGTGGKGGKEGAKAPRTDTIAETRDRPLDPVALLPGALAVGFGVLGLAWIAIRLIRPAREP